MKKAALLLAAAMGLASTPALASQFDYSAFTVTDGQNITLSGLVSETVDAGQIVLTGSGPNAGQMLDVWCVDVFHVLQSSALFNIVPLTTAGSGAPNPTLTAAQINQIGSLMLAGNKDVADNALGVDGSTAFQLAIWAVEYGGALLDNANSTLAALVTTLVAESATGGSLNDPFATVELLDAPAQNQVLAFAVDAVPLPGTLWLMLSGLGLLFGGLYRRGAHSCSALAESCSA